MGDGGRCYRIEPGGVLLAVRLTPRAARDAVDGTGALSDGRPVALVRVRALPSEGAANAALVAVIAKRLRGGHHRCGPRRPAEAGAHRRRPDGARYGDRWMGHCHALGLSFLLLPVAVAPAAAENTSAYTRLDLAACRSIPPDPDDPLQSGEWWCDGHGNWPVHVTEGDLRFFVSYGEDALDQPAAGTTLPAFNHLGPTIEWRIDGDGTALATILRWYTSSGDGGPDGQTLVITRLGGPGEVCHVGYVDARTNPDANAIARDVADNGARDFDCGRDTPLQYGLVGGDGDARD